MSDINIKKDDQATQEMLEMMGELSEEMDSTLQSKDGVQTDELLDELEGLPNELEEEPLATIETTEPQEETPLDVDDIDSLMAEINEDTETSIETSPPSITAAPKTIENTASKDADEHMEVSAIEDEDNLETTAQDEIEMDSITNEDNIAPPSEDIADINASVIEDEAIENEPSAPKEQTEPTVQVEQLISQTQQAVDTMVEAIQIDQEIQEIASSVHNNAQEAIQIAISTSEQAQQSAEQIQHAIEATFAASDNAFNAAKEAGYHINLDDINTEKPAAEIIEQLQEIETKNKKLKEVNQNLKQRISELK
ncbi:MAG: hypothetical protein L3J00_02645 [Thiomicrorhabdus sp.]|nr:hypothetical protein [Thiomicrorhabdus sp.]